MSFAVYIYIYIYTYMYMFLGVVVYPLGVGDVEGDDEVALPRNRHRDF